MKLIGNASRQETGRWLNNRAEDSHLPFRRKERAVGIFLSFETLQKFVSAHSSVHNRFSQERHLNRRETSRQSRPSALAEWHQLAA
jgi:putative transposase